MSDFDKFLGDKLNEETPFPRREKNWDALSKRLDAFDTGLKGSGHRHLKYWKIAAMGAVAVASWLAWETYTARAENAALREQVAALQQPLPATELPESSFPEPATPQKNKPELTPAETAEDLPQADPAQLETPIRSTRTAAKASPKPAPQKDAAKAGNLLSKLDLKPLKSTVYPEKTTPADSNNTPVSDRITPTSPDIARLNLLVDSLRNVLAEQTQAKAASQTPADALVQSSFPDSAQTAAPDSAVAKPAETLVAVAEPLKKDTVSALPPPPASIQPVHKPLRFRVGIQALFGAPAPRDAGISLLTGQGFAAEFAVLRRLWLTASADWVKYDICTDQYLPKFHYPHHPPHGQPHFELAKVEGTQRQQHYGIGIRYALPVKFWARPSVSIAHNWVRQASSVLSFKFEDKDPNPGPGHPHDPEYIAQRTDAKTVGNVWRFGAGFDREMQRWVVSLRADYSRNMSGNDKMFDALLVRAGLQYQF